MKIIRLGEYWGYTENKCGGCRCLEESAPFPDGHVLVACDAPEGMCEKDGMNMYG